MQSSTAGTQPQQIGDRLQLVRRTFVSNVDAFENDGDRLAVKFQTRVGYTWVRADRRELVDLLQRSLHTGEVAEVTFDLDSLEIDDVILR